MYLSFFIKPLLPPCVFKKAPNKIVGDARLPEVLRESLKTLFDGAVSIEPHGVAPLGPIQELIVEKLDIESIWQVLIYICVFICL